jgi:STE24 endopeptidase
MNVYGIIILTAFLCEYVLDLIANTLNTSRLGQELPPEFIGSFNQDEFIKSQNYTRVHTYFGIIESTFDLVIVLIFWFLGGFNELDKIVSSWELSQIWSGLAFIGILLLGYSILSLPFQIYSTFVIEEKFGFNKTTPRIFITDMFKMIALAVLMGGPLLAGVLAFFQYTGNWAWLYCWLITVIFAVVVQFIAPAWILPLFNKFTPLQDGELRQTILNYIDKIKFPVQGIYITDGSKRSSKSNAYFTGFGRNKRIALFDTLIEKHTISELLSILAHEIGHFKKKHIFIGMSLGFIHTGIMFYLLSLFISLPGLFQAFHMEHISIYGGMIFFSLLYSPIEFILSIFFNILSRRHEFQADQFAVQTTGDADAFIQALKKLSVHNLSNLTPHPFLVFIHYSHPAILPRIQRIRTTS